MKVIIKEKDPEGYAKCDELFSYSSAEDECSIELKKKIECEGVFEMAASHSGYGYSGFKTPEGKIYIPFLEEYVILSPEDADEWFEEVEEV